jgi:hypothetical protein
MPNRKRHLPAPETDVGAKRSKDMRASVAPRSAPLALTNETLNTALRVAGRLLYEDGYILSEGGQYIGHSGTPTGVEMMVSDLPSLMDGHDIVCAARDISTLVLLPQLLRIFIAAGGRVFHSCYNMLAGAGDTSILVADLPSCPISSAIDPIMLRLPSSASSSASSSATTSARNPRFIDGDMVLGRTSAYTLVYDMLPQHYTAGYGHNKNRNPSGRVFLHEVPFRSRSS